MAKSAYPHTLKVHLRASVAAAMLLGLVAGGWIVGRSSDASLLEVVVAVVGWIVLNVIVFSRIDGVLLPKG